MATTTNLNALLGRILDATRKGPPPVPEGWFTSRQARDETGVDKTTLERKLRNGVAAGILERKLWYGRVFIYREKKTPPLPFSSRRRTNVP